MRKWTDDELMAWSGPIGTVLDEILLREEELRKHLLPTRPSSGMLLDAYEPILICLLDCKFLHYKQDVENDTPYTITGVSISTNEGEGLCVQYTQGFVVWSRPLTSFFEVVDREGTRRFTQVMEVQ